MYFQLFFRKLYYLEEEHIYFSRGNIQTISFHPILTVLLTCAHVMFAFNIIYRTFNMITFQIYAIQSISPVASSYTIPRRS